MVLLTVYFSKGWVKVEWPGQREKGRWTSARPSRKGT